MRFRSSTTIAMAFAGLFLFAVCGWAGSFSEYVLTQDVHEFDSNMQAIAVLEFGPGAQVADWDDLVSDFTGQIAAFCDAVGLTEYRDSAWVYLSGEGFHTPERHYFVERHNGSVPGGWAAFDEIDGNTLSLGSWFDPRRILVRIAASPVESSTWSVIKALYR